MRNFCTYFDSYYIAKGLALYSSLDRVLPNFHLYVMAFDKDCYNRLVSLNLEKMTVEFLEDFETPELLAVKPLRSRGEYCWTCGPSVIYHFLTQYNLNDITYLDSDLFFLNSPEIVYDEIGNNSVAITEQGLNEKEAKMYGKYCVQYMYFRNDQIGLDILTWWRDSCIEWCFQKIEPTRYGDQKYLDEFPIRWNNVHVIKNLGVGIAPWNMNKYKYSDSFLSYEGQRYSFIFFHMHGIKIEVVNEKLRLNSLHFVFKQTMEELFLMPYAEIVKKILNDYLGYEIKSIELCNMSVYKQLEYRLRTCLRGFRIIQWIYFGLLKRKNKGHGTKM